MISVDARYHEHPSRPRNPLLAVAFHRARLIEHWGTGTLRMVQECEARQMPRPEFLFSMGVFIVRFRPAAVENGAAIMPLPDLSGLRKRQS
ncbi:MAG TPA: ATP-binding protein [Armatimonadota bacterium]|nr:ATP-binding protein [Armatimonadota bacterium]